MRNIHADDAVGFSSHPGTYKVCHNLVLTWPAIARRPVVNGFYSRPVNRAGYNAAGGIKE